MTIEMRHLQAFVAIVDNGNLSRAARAVHLSQPALSRALAQLERSVGETLIERSTHHCQPTAAGIRFAVGARDALRAVDDAVAAAHGRQRDLVLGHSWSAGGYLAAIVRTWNRHSRSCELRVARIDDVEAALADRTIDAAIVRSELDPAVFSMTLLDREARVAVLPAEHPLADESSLRLGDLAKEKIITSTIGVTTATLWPEGARPVVEVKASGVDDWLVAIAAGIGVGVSVAATAALHPHPSVRYVPLVDAPRVPVALAFPWRGAHPACDDLAGIVGKLATNSSLV